MSKATVQIFLKDGVLDPQGTTIHKNLERMGFEGVKGVRIGKCVEIELDEKAQWMPACGGEAENYIAKLCDDLLANPVMEDYKITIQD